MLPLCLDGCGELLGWVFLEQSKHGCSPWSVDDGLSVPREEAACVRWCETRDDAREMSAGDLRREELVGRYARTAPQALHA